MKTATQLVETFTYQSYFDNALLQTAILPQTPGGDLIVESTLKRPQVAGVGLALHPASECPVAVRLSGERESGTIILTPGTVFDTGPFERFEWGLPYGWLGGGTALLDILHKGTDGPARFRLQTSSPDLLFHRQRLAVILDAVPVALPVINWPVAFPWANAFSGAQAQPGSDVLVVQPTWTMLRLRTTLAAPLTVYGVWRATQDFDTSSTGASSSADVTVQEISFPVTPAGTFPIVWLEDPVTRLGGRNSIFYIADPSNTIVAAFVDAVRWGKIG